MGASSWEQALQLGVAAALGLAAMALGTVAWLRAHPRRQQRLQQVGTVAQLWIYPIKSCKGVSVREAECTAMGLRCGHLRDRYVEGERGASPRLSGCEEVSGVGSQVPSFPD